MSKKTDNRKLGTTVVDALGKASEVSKKVIESTQRSAEAISEKTKNNLYQRKMEKYNPIFPEEYKEPAFNIPNIIIIVDDAVRRGIDVCEGAIGWLSKDSGAEVLYLYDEAVGMSGMQFIPFAKCDTAYYVDHFNRSRFICTDNIFSKAHEERVAELKHIAFSLGAKKCVIEISESTVERKVNKKKLNLSSNLNLPNVGKVASTAGEEQSSSFDGNTQRKGRIVAEFEGSDTPKKPELKWFAQDDNIKRLIEMRLKNINNNVIKSETFELDGMSSFMMSQKAAKYIDNAIGKFGGKGSSDIEEKVLKEMHSKLIFQVEF